MANRSEERRRLEARTAELRGATWAEVAETYALAHRELRRRVRELTRHPEGLRAAVAEMDPVQLRTFRLAVHLLTDTLGAFGRATRLTSGYHDDGTPPPPEELEHIRKLGDALAVEQLTRGNGP